MLARPQGRESLPYPDSVLDLAPGGIVVVPSIDYRPLRYEPSPGVEHLEERMLFVLLWLKRPGLQIAYVTSTALDPILIADYMRFLPDAEEAASRLELVALDDPRHRPLSRKLLMRPDVTGGLRRFAARAKPTWLLPFKVTEDEIELSSLLGLPLFGPSPEALYYGTKSGGRTAGRLAHARLPEGQADLRSMRDVEQAVDTLLARNHGTEGVVVKLNHGVGGLGHAIVDEPLSHVPLSSAATTFGSAFHSWSTYEKEIEDQGAVVEELIRGRNLTSPSVQMVIAPDGSLRELSTHDQILEGRHMQNYKACRFPARVEYRRLIQKRAADVGKVLTSLGIRGFFSVDFLVRPEDSSQCLYLCEINLRMSATTLPRFVTQELTGARYHERTGDLIADGRPKFYMATDGLQSNSYVGLTAQAVLDDLHLNGLDYNRELSKGVVPHMLGALGSYGRLGVTCIADSSREADDLYAQVQAFLDRLASLPRRAAS